jgi:ribosomal protein S18 acetylase RimI-like enzyme
VAQEVAGKRAIIRELGDGLVMRRATVEDADALAAFNANIHREDNTTEPDEEVAAWTRDLVSGRHPTMRAGDNLIVEDTRTGAIVSSVNLISQRWTYGGIEFPVGRPELVGTHPDYRNRGLVRAQFEVIHQWSAERGEMVQAITGIPYYYRIFGYEMALELDAMRLGYQPHVPKLKEGETDPYRLRPATSEDLPFISRLYEQAGKRSLVGCVRDKEMWEYELLGRDPRARHELRVIERVEDGEPVGFLKHPAKLWGPSLVCTYYELKPGVSWLAVTPGVIRYLAATGEEYAERDSKPGKKQEFAAFGFRLGSEHPAYEVVQDRLPRVRPPYAWYIRVPDLPAFIRHIAPVLEDRLAASPAVGHTGELKISFYRDGLRLAFDKGRLAAVERWRPRPEDRGAAGFPDLTFLQMLFGHRSMEELRSAFPDCYPETDEARVLLKYLFPKQASFIVPIF